MRNLKKFLALVLAMMMAFSLMVTVNAKDITADFTDAESVTEEFQTAVDVTNGMGILKGYEDGTYKPKNNIRRSEMTALVYRLATGDAKDESNEIHKNYVTFKDVATNDWFAGYVGYCQNAELIKGDGAGNFMPNRDVTGYEALAMILRAMGYDQNHEFEGTGWQVRVGSIATQRGILDNINNTNYAATLSMPATRELVAEMIFQAAQKNRVVYTTAFGYQSGDFTDTNIYNEYTPLGKLHYGLTEVTGIIVGNQDTGESKTIINTALPGAASHSEYFYDNSQYLAKTDTKTTPVTTSAKIDAKTGIDMFGHKVNAWYCATSGKGATAGKTFALYDNVKKTAVVTLDAADATARLSNENWANAGDARLGEAAQKAGFTVDLKSSKAVYNQSFGKSGTEKTNGGSYLTDYNIKGDRIADGDAKTPAISATKDGQTGNTAYPLYLLISNNSSLTVDMIVALNVEVSRVSQVNAHAKVPTVTVPTLAKEWNTKQTAATVSELLPQTALTATSTKTLADPVVGVSIVGTTTYKPSNETTTLVDGNNGNFWRRLSKPTQTVEGTVTNFNYDAASHTGSIVIGGKKIERSLLADAIVDYNPAPATANRGIVGNKPVGLSATAQNYGNYRAYLDSEGKYIWVEPIYDTKFVYGTYLDYTTPYGSSSYEYTLIGVDLEGKQVKQVVKTLDGVAIGSSNYQSIVPYRDSTSVAGVTPLYYQGFLLDGDGNLTSVTPDATNPDTAAGKFETISPVVYQAGRTTSADGGIISNGAGEVVEITTTDAKLGTVNLDQNSTTATNAATTYFTNDTKFIVVDGAGTDTQKIEVYNGLTELLKGGSRVTISGSNTLATNGAYLANSAGGGWPFNRQMFYTQSPMTYASVDGNLNYKVDTIVLPKAAITWTGASGLYYVGNPAQDSEIKSGTRTYHLYTMYLDGEAQQVWLMNAPGGTNPGTSAANPGDYALKSDSFYRLYPTSFKTPMGDTVYVANDGSNNNATTADAVAQSLNGDERPDLANGAEPILGDGIVSYAFYNAASYASQTAIIGAGGTDAGTVADMTVGTNCAIFNVSNAKVVNLNAANSPTSGNSDGYVWPGVTDLTSLNDAASTAMNYGGKLPKVCVQVDPTDNLTVTVIYVCWDQTQAT